MKERPILFSGSMVRAILSGTKSMTRRVVKPQPHHDCAAIEVDRFHPTVIDRHGDEQPGAEIFGAYSLDGEWGARCPYGVPGDRLWVREMFSYVYGQHSPQIDSGLPVHFWADGNPEDGDWTRPKPGIHMPRWASRLTLTITDVRVERVQNISDGDARAEGVEPVALNAWGSSYVGGFGALWDSLNAKRGHGWQHNPWVWVLTFAPPSGAPQEGVDRG